MPFDKTEFANWALSLGIDGKTLSLLVTLPNRFPDRELIQRFIPSLTEIRELNDEEPLGTAAIQDGFITIGSCPDGDPIAIDLKTNPGAVHFISHEELDGNSVITKMVARDLQSFVRMMDHEIIAYDFHEAVDINEQSN